MIKILKVVVESSHVAFDSAIFKCLTFFLL